MQPVVVIHTTELFGMMKVMSQNVEKVTLSVDIVFDFSTAVLYSGYVALDSRHPFFWDILIWDRTG